ncbi:Putative type III restriction-modification system HindVIP enzyme mod [Planktothrix rubescens]|nr:Putative type III restriction-modification system HindVIP enzyme mod [Planktothrix rubescens]
MKLYKTLEQQLKKEPNFVTDNGELKKWVVLNKAQNFDEELIGLLLDHAELKERFFVTVKGILVFNLNLFVQFLEQKNYLNSSYTQYKNKVGLTIDGKYLKQRNEVALVWPFKDCILEGGQSSEEDKREEIFFNEILAQDEITQLLEPKVLTNAKRINKEGEKPLDQFNRNENGTITDNLIIKGNNLLALHTLKEEFAGKVKLIYIDPPYNTGRDSFKYNDSFSRSTWLTFMRNRLLIAKRLLLKEGTIFVHLDYNAIHYCKLLMDDIFGENNFINEIIWRRKQAASFGNSKFGITNDTILFYSNSENYTFNPIYSLDDENTQNYIKERFVYDDGDGEKFMKSPLVNSLYRPNLKYVFQGINPPKNGWLYSKEKMQEFFDNNELIIPDDPNARIYRKIYLKSYKGQVIQNIWTDIPIVNPMAKEQVDFNTQKPEKLLQRIIQSVTNENDIVLDYHLGSGTTASTAHKMNRQYIGIEQMDYIETIALERLKKVIEGEQGGISKSVSWQGGGSFVYLELKKYNQTFIEQIETAKDTETLLQVWEQMKGKSFLNYNVDIKKQDEHLEEFKALSLTEQKQHLCELLDKNQLYVNLSSLNDEDFACTEEEKKVTKDFYQITE